MSNFTIDHLETIIKDTGVVPAVNQVERHPKLNQNELIAYAKSKNIHITAYSAFGNNGWGLPLLINTPEIKAIADRLSSTQGKEVTPAQVILAWAQIGGNSVIPKSVTPSRIRANFDEIELDEEAIKAVEKIGETAQRYNIPNTCEFPSFTTLSFNHSHNQDHIADNSSQTDNPKWSINIWNEEKEKDAAHTPVVKV